jgi:hypothetical protein
MKNKTHLFYGIIIGILLCACVGSNSNKTFSEVHTVRWSNELDRWVAMGTYENESEKPDLPSAENGGSFGLVKMGWTIIDMEFHPRAGTDNYVIGK